MTEDEIEFTCRRLANIIGEFYTHTCKTIPKQIVITSMTGSLAACAFSAGMERENVIAALNSAFNDIEASEKEGRFLES